MSKLNKQMYIVGGAVRDSLLGITPCDIDYCAVGYTESDFAGMKRVGKSFPVYLDDFNNEIALARTENKTGKGYNGFSVNYTPDTPIEMDLGRRDLTINAMAINMLTKELIDPYNGKSDLENGILRHTTEKFTQDPLRVLRLARFRAKFPEFKIAPETKVLVYTMRNELQDLQPNRIWKEIEKVMSTSNSWIFWETLLELQVLDVLFPNIFQMVLLKEGSKYHSESSLFVHTMMVLKRLDSQDLTLKLTALFHDIKKPDSYKKYGMGKSHDTNFESLIESELEIPTKIKKTMFFLIKNHIRVFRTNEMKPNKIATFLESYRKDVLLLENQIKLGIADSLGRITKINKKIDSLDTLLVSLKEIASYSPVKWINEQENRPSSLGIKNHIHRVNINIIKKNK